MNAKRCNGVCRIVDLFLSLLEYMLYHIEYLPYTHAHIYSYICILDMYFVWKGTSRPTTTAYINVSHC